MSKVGRIVGVVVAVACVGSFAMAECGAKHGKKPVKEKAAKHKAVGGQFKAADADANGSISLTEFNAVHEKRIADRKAKMGDKWSEERAAKMPTAAAIFKKLDKDADGALSPKEMKKGKRHREGKGKKDKAGKRARKVKKEKTDE